MFNGQNYICLYIILSRFIHLLNNRMIITKRKCKKENILHFQGFIGIGIYLGQCNKICWNECRENLVLFTFLLLNIWRIMFVYIHLLWICYMRENISQITKLQGKNYRGELSRVSHNLLSVMKKLSFVRISM